MINLGSRADFSRLRLQPDQAYKRVGVMDPPASWLISILVQGDSEDHQGDAQQILQGRHLAEDDEPDHGRGAGQQSQHQSEGRPW